MGKMSQRKGAAGEIELTEILKSNGYNVKRGGSLNYGAFPDIMGLKDVHVEVKRREKLNLLSAIQQAQTDAARFHDGQPAVFHRRNREPWLVTMTLEEWLTLYRKAAGNNDG